jgi:amino acid adenylation domain-containing protein
MSRNCDIRVLLAASNKLGNLTRIINDGTPIERVILLDEPASSSDVAFPAGVAFTTWKEVRALDASSLPANGAIETDLAYILYTSGSTGDPKGVMISHRTIFTFVDWCSETLQVTEHDRVTSHAPLHFDLSTFDIFVTIKAGGTVVLVPETHSVFPLELVRLIQREAVSIIYMVPSILSMMVTYGKLDTHDLSKLRMVLFAGEVFPIKYLRKLVDFMPHCSFYNLYGPTETNVCTYYQVQEKDLLPELTIPVPIGVACENMEVFALDEGGQRVTEIGQEGELWVRGSCVAEGYWGDEEKTARGFAQNPLHNHFRDISYRTGDIVTLDEDGKNWRFIGRRDHMIKSRGYRIELGEIEAALYGHASVKEAAAVAIPDDLLGNRIKAFVVPVEKNGLTVQELQAFCREKLPRYMAPEIIEFRSELPKTSTGKVNRSELVRE